MAQFGSHPSTWSSFQFSGLNTQNIGAQPETMPAPGGWITSLSCFFGGDGASVNAQLGVWDATGVLLGSTAAFLAASGSHAAGGQVWQVQALSAPLWVPGGMAVLLGWWRDPAGSSVWSSAGGSGYDLATLTPSSVIGNTGALSAQAGVIGAYADYTPAGQVYVNGVRSDVYVNGVLASTYLNGVLI